MNEENVNEETTVEENVETVETTTEASKHTAEETVEAAAATEDSAAPSSAEEDRDPDLATGDSPDFKWFTLYLNMRHVFLKHLKRESLTIKCLSTFQKFLFQKKQ